MSKKKAASAAKTATTKASKKAAPKKAAKTAATPAAPSTPALDTTPVLDPCADGHKWDTDAAGVEHCTVCLADRKVIEQEAKPKKKVAKAKKEAPSADRPAPVKTTKKAKAAQPIKPASDGKLSALDAAAQVLAASAEPLNAKQMIEQMASKGLWTSPGGKTPHATLYSAILREIQVKGKQARFKKTDRGHFAANN